MDELLEMRVGVGNSGNRIAGPGWFIRVLLSDDAHIDSTDQLIEQFVTTRELVLGAQDLYLRNIKLSGAEPGDYYIGSILDVTDVVPELSDSNNTPPLPGGLRCSRSRPANEDELAGAVPISPSLWTPRAGPSHNAVSGSIVYGFGGTTCRLISRRAPSSL